MRSSALAARPRGAVVSIAEAIAGTRTELASLRDGQDAGRLVHDLSAAEAADDRAAIVRAGASSVTSQSVALSLQVEIHKTFEACKLQGSAGQRISMAPRALAFIETRVGPIHGIRDGGEVGFDPSPERTSDVASLNGPTLPRAAAVFRNDVGSCFPRGSDCS